MSLFFKCIKQDVQAEIEFPSGIKFKSSNFILNGDVKECPRDAQNMKSGEGYHLCKDVCMQTAHAEINVINRYKEALSRDKEYYNYRNHLMNINEATLILKNHEYMCDNCFKHVVEIGIKNVVIKNAYSETGYSIEDGKLKEMYQKPTYLMKVGDLVYFEFNQTELANEPKIPKVKNNLNRVVGKISKFLFHEKNGKEVIFVEVKYENSSIISYTGMIESLKKVKD